MLKERMMPRDKRGFTLTEAAIVLGIVGLILGAIWVAAAAVYNNLRVSTTSNQLLQIVQSIRSMHATQQTVDAALNANNIASAGGLPKDMVLTNAAGAVTGVRNVWGGGLVIQSAAGGTAFSVQFTGVPQGACTDLLVRNTGSGRDSGLIGAAAASATATVFPLTLTTALAACPSIAASTPTFTFRLKS